jgi:hypothetical protein
MDQVEALIIQSNEIAMTIFCHDFFPRDLAEHVNTL